FHRGVVGLDRFQVHVFGNRDAIVKAANNGEVNAATDMTITDTQSITRKTTMVEQKPINSGMYALLNTKSPALSSKEVRQALQVGTNTKAVRDAVSSELQSLDLPFTTTQLRGSGIPSAPKHDRTKAQTILNEAGWQLQNGVRVKDGNTLRLSVVALKNNDSEKALDVLVSQWRDLGIVVTTNIVDPNDQLQNVAQTILQPRQYDVLLYQLTLGGDPDFVYAYWHSSQASAGVNLSNYSNAISDDALESARQRTDQNLRREKYISFAKQWLSDVPAIGLYQLSAQYAYSRSVHAMPSHQTLISTGDRYATVPYWSVGERQVYRTP
ncbi:MAG TPA: ABC transporter substrate-binding protein, partial [Candidatus Saccharibacteria bacterium]|nr:ABC transporter substrate-binding protein [Candidatus Saccharibacteria bacterium]